MAKQESVSDRLYRLIEEGLIDAEEIAKMFIKWSSNDDIQEMLNQNDVNIRSSYFD